MNHANNVFNVGMKLFQNVQDSSAVDMVMRQAELIELLDRLLKVPEHAETKRSARSKQLHYEESETSHEMRVKGFELPENEDLAGVTRYLLVCWLDELFVVDTPLTRLWNENKLEMRIFGTNDRAWRFWDYVKSDPVSKSLEARQVALSCVMHGFQGQMAESHSELAVWVEKCRASLLKSAKDSWTPPPALPIMAETPPLTGRGELDLVIRLAIAFGVVLVPAISFLIVYSLRS